MKQSIKQIIIIMFVIISLALIIVGCNGGGNLNPFSQLTQDEIEITVEVGEPIQVKQPFAVTITVVTKEDIPNLEVMLSTGNPQIQLVDGFSEYWVIDSVAQQPIVFTTTIKIMGQGSFGIIAFAKDPSIARVVDGYVSLELTNKGAVVNPTPDKNRSALTIITSTHTSKQVPVLTPYPTTTSQAQRSVNHLDTPIGNDDGKGGFGYALSPPNIPPNTIINNTSIKLLINHSHPEELKIVLIGPDNTTKVTLWEYEKIGSDNLYEGLFYINHLNLSEFNGLATDGIWLLQVQDDVAGNAGTLESITFAVNYQASSVSTP